MHQLRDPLFEAQNPARLTDAAWADHGAAAAPRFVGIGSPHGDDRLGWHVADLLSRRLGDAAEVIKLETPIDLLARLDAAGRLVICDACQGSGAPGTICRGEWPEMDVIGNRAGGSHDLGLRQTLELAAQLGRFDSVSGPIVFWTVEAAQVKPGEAISAAVMAVIPELITCIEKDLFPGDHRCEASPAPIR